MSPLPAILLLALAAQPGGDAHSPVTTSTTVSSSGTLDRGAESHFPGATEVQKCTFEPAHDDAVYDWPSGWTRRHGPGFPRYIHVRVDGDHPPSGGRSLLVELNGGAASAFGPSIAVSPGVDYVLEGYVKTSELQHDAAWLSLSFLDSARLKVSDVTSEKIDGTTGWRKVRIGPLSPPAGASLLVVSINVVPQGVVQDLRGKASFGALWVGRLPRMGLTARLAEEARGQMSDVGGQTSDLRSPTAGDASFLVFARGKPIEISCLVSGFDAPKYALHLELEDRDGHVLAQHQADVSTAAGNSASTAWQITGDKVGFYRVRAHVVSGRIKGDSPHLPERPGGCCAQMGTVPFYSPPQAELGLAIIDREQSSAASEFGWSLDPQDTALGLVPIGDLLGQAGIRWVKFPFVCRKAKEAGSTEQGVHAPRSPLSPPDRMEPLISFNDRLGDAGIGLIGVLHPPAATAEARAPGGYPLAGAGRPANDLLAIEGFSADAKTWYPSIEPVLARLATEIRFWQIGDDRDPGWIGCRDLPAAVSRVKTELDRIGQDVNVGIAWKLGEPLPATVNNGAGSREQGAGSKERGARTPCSLLPARCFFSLPCDAAMSDAELAARLDATASPGVARWLAIDALPREGHSADDRIVHLIGRVVTAKLHGAEGIYFAHPFDPERGLVGRDGSPSELFLPWRTAALMLGGAPYVGDIDLPGGGRMQCFGGAPGTPSRGRYVGLITGGGARGQRPEVRGQTSDLRPLTSGLLCLGDHVQACDLWGHVTPLGENGDITHLGAAPSRPSGQMSDVPVFSQQLPIFLSGLDGPLTEWQLGLAFTPKSLPSIPNAIEPVALSLKNTLPQAVSGRVRITPPQNWFIAPQVAEFHLEPGATWTLPLEVALPNDVIAGRQIVPLEFDLQAERTYHFTAYRPIEVVLGEVALEAAARLNAQGELEVRQTFSNRGKQPLHFRCELLAPDRRRQATEIFVQASAKSECDYRLPDGRDLLGKSLWLRAEETDGPRVLNYRLDVQ